MYTVSMELQLGLSLSSSSSLINPIKLGFDLNNDNFSSSIIDDHGSCFESNKNKRRFGKAFNDDDDQNTNSSSSSVVTQKTLPLLLWNDQPNEDDDDDDHLNRATKRTSCPIINEVEEEVSSVVGWPPVKSWMKKRLINHHHHNPHQHHVNVNDHDQDGCVEDEDHRREGNGNGSNGASNRMYVKVMMEGMPIGRKVDLSLHQSYQTLTATLINMFGKYQKKAVKGQKDGTRYTLTYQDREGDWLLVGDVPWHGGNGTMRNRVRFVRLMCNMGQKAHKSHNVVLVAHVKCGAFIGSVQRLKILRDGC